MVLGQSGIILRASKPENLFVTNATPMATVPGQVAKQDLESLCRTITETITWRYECPMVMAVQIFSKLTTTTTRSVGIILPSLGKLTMDSLPKGSA